MYVTVSATIFTSQDVTLGGEKELSSDISNNADSAALGAFRCGLFDDCAVRISTREHVLHSGLETVFIKQMTRRWFPA
jgi:hypothetical protein